jgi:hypothetical protein
MLLFMGCGPGMMADPVPVTGKATFADGKPVSGVILTLQPTRTGHLTGFKLNADGTFQGDAVPGTYTYFFNAESDDAAYKNIPEKFRSADLERIVTVSKGSDLKIVLN